MGENTAIAWTDHTFNPWMGCHKVTAGCKHCYAETLTKTRMGIDVWGLNGTRRRTGKQTWRKPFRWNLDAIANQERRRVFVASLADIFEDKEECNEWRPDVWDVIRNTPWLDYQLLTKRPENIARMLPDDWPLENVWLGTSIESNEHIDRAAHLISIECGVHFVSYEPALGPLDKLDLTDIEWLICGGESGPGYRPMDLEWAHDIRERCEAAGTAFFFKQNSAPRTEMGIDALGEVVRHFPRDRSSR